MPWLFTKCDKHTIAEEILEQLKNKEVIDIYKIIIYLQNTVDPPQGAEFFKSNIGIRSTPSLFYLTFLQLVFSLYKHVINNNGFSKFNHQKAALIFCVWLTPKKYEYIINKNIFTNEVPCTQLSR